MSNLRPMDFAEARNGFTGKALTNAQFAEGWLNAQIMRIQVRQSASFIEKLSDQAYSLSRSQRFDVHRGETIIREIYQDRYGESLNQTRERLLERAEHVRQQPKTKTIAFEHARQIESLIADGDTLPFYRAYDMAARRLAQHFKIPENSAKELMKEAFKTAEGKELYDWGKALEKEHHAPVRDATRRQSQSRLERRPERSRA